MPISSSDRPDNATARLAGLLESAMDAIITVNAAQNILLYNRAAETIFGWPAAEVLGQPLVKLIPQRFHASHGGHMKRFATTGVTSRRMGGSNLVYGLRRSGEEFPVEASISQLDTPDGHLFTVILRDATERIRAQEELAAYAAQASAIREQEKTAWRASCTTSWPSRSPRPKMDTIWLRDHAGTAGADVQAKLAGMLAMLDASVAATRRIAA